MKQSYRKILYSLVAMILVLTALAMPFSFSYWLSGLRGSRTDTYARFLFDFLDSETPTDPYERLEEINTPAGIIDSLRELEDDLNPYEFELFMEALESFTSSLTAYQMYENVYLAKSAESLFSDGKRVVGDDIIILLTISPDTGQPEILLVHIHEDFTFAGNDYIDNASTLFEALNAPWSNIYGHYISNVFVRGNRYTRRHAPVEVGGKYYLFLGNGWGDYSPVDGGEWRVVLNDEYEHDPYNRSYFKDSIVKFSDGNYYIATTHTWNAQPGWGWSLIPQFTVGATYDKDAVVYTLEECIIETDEEAPDAASRTTLGACDGIGRTTLGAGDGIGRTTLGAGDDSIIRAGTKVVYKPHFWRAIASGTTTEPSAASAQGKIWRELDNRWGWVGDDPSNDTIRSQYVIHNYYDEGDVVIYGSSPTFRYRYYRAVSEVPPNEKPLIYTQDSIPQLNSQYWEPIYDYGN